MLARAPVFPVLLAVALLVPALPAAAHDTDPGVSPSFALFPTYAEVRDGLDAAADHPWVTLHEVGVSGEGKALRLAEITDPESPVPLEERVITFIFTQQHGNEPAGTPAALDLLEQITAGDPIADTLRNQVLLLFPMVNPDGAAKEQRRNSQDVDINRDHMALETPEARAVHEVLNRWDVHVAMDHHEYGGTGPGLPAVGTAYDFDLTTLFPVHGNVRAATDEAAKDLMYEGIWPAAEENGYTKNEYGEYETAGVPIQKVAGGPDPGIMRNHLGLHHIAGLLVETRVDAHPNPFHDFERRVEIHKVVMDATLEYASENAERFRVAKGESMTAELESPVKRYEEGARTGPISDAYLVKESLDDVFAFHGLPLGAPADAGVVYDLRDPLRAHMAALLHPESSRALVPDAQATEPLQVAAEDAPTDGGELTVPGPAPLLVLALLGGAGALRTRTHPGRGRKR